MSGYLLGEPPQHVLRDEIKIAYWDTGEGVPLVLITGLATPAASWSILPDMLASAGYRTVVIDNRDCGKSSRCAETTRYTIVDMADDVAAVMDALAIGSAYVLGISMGGMIAQELTLQHPEKVRKLMLLATSHGGPSSVVADAEYLTDLFAPVSQTSREEAMFHLVTKLTGPGFSDRNPEAIQVMATARSQFGSEQDAFSRQWEAISTFDTSDRLRDIDVPTMIVHGTADRLVPAENGRLISEQITNAQLIELPGVGHLVPLEDPVTTTQLIAGFFPVQMSAEAV